MVIVERDERGRIIRSKGRESICIDLPRAVELYKQAFSILEVAGLMGISRSVIRRRFKALGICKSKGWRSRHCARSEETKSRMSAGRKLLLSDPKTRVRLFAGKNNPFFGKKHKPETIAAMKVKVSALLTGERNPQWKGGISLEPYARGFKKVREWVYLRDNYECQRCNVRHKPKSGWLVAHHIDTDKMNSDIDNLITLCRSCHGKVTMGARWSKEVIGT